MLLISQIVTCNIITKEGNIFANIELDWIFRIIIYKSNFVLRIHPFLILLVRNKLVFDKGAKWIYFHTNRDNGY